MCPCINIPAKPVSQDSAELYCLVALQQAPPNWHTAIMSDTSDDLVSKPAPENDVGVDPREAGAGFIVAPRAPSSADDDMEPRMHNDSMDLSPASKPLFLRSSDPSTWEKPEETTWGDWSLDPNPDKPLNARQKEVARLLFLGKSQTAIAASVGYTIAWVNRLASNTKMQLEVDRMRNLAFERTVGERLKDIGPASMEVIEEGIRSTSMKLKDRTELARWVVEKLDGKAGQKVDVQSSTLERFMEVLADMKNQGEVLDVTPAKPEADHIEASVRPTNDITTNELPPVEDWSKWFDSNISG